MREHHLDCCGLQCPMPIVRISRAISELQAGDTLTVTADDAAFSADVAAWAKKTGNTLVDFAPGPPARAVIQKIGQPPHAP